MPNEVLTEAEILAASIQAAETRDSKVTNGNGTPPVKKAYDMKSLQKSGTTNDTQNMTSDNNGVLQEERYAESTLKNAQTYQLNREEYEDYLDEVRPERGVEALNTARAQNQSHWEQFGAAINQAIIGEITGGTISALGSLFELPSIIHSKITGETADFNNGVIQLGQDLIDWSHKATPIYQERPGEAFQISDPAWWFQNSVSVASAASMLIPAKATMSALSWMNKLAATTGKAAKAKGLARTGNALQWGQRAGVSKDLIKQGTSALVMRHAENTREAFGVVNDVKEKMLFKFDDETQWEAAKNSEAAKELAKRGVPLTKQNLAEHIASRAGHQSYNINFTNIIFDFIQAGALIKGTAHTRAAINSRKVKGALKKRVEGKYVTKAAATEAKIAVTAAETSKFTKVKNWTGNLLRQGTEGVEEAINFIGEKEGKVLAQQLIGEDEGSFAKRLANYAQDPHLYEVAFWGAMGGIAFESIGNLFGGNNNKSIEEQQLATIAAREVHTQMMVEQLKKAQTDFNEGKYTLQETKDRVAAIKSKNGSTMGTFAAINGSTNVLLEQLENGQFKDDILNSMTTEELKEIGINDIDKAVVHLKQEVLNAEKNFNKVRGKIFGLDIDADEKAGLLFTVMERMAARERFQADGETYKGRWADLLNNDSNLNTALGKDPLINPLLQKEAYSETANYYRTKALEQKLKGNKQTERAAIRLATIAENAISALDKLHPTLKDKDSSKKLFTALGVSEDVAKEALTLQINLAVSETEFMDADNVTKDLLTDEGAQAEIGWKNGVKEVKKKADESREFGTYKASIMQEVNKNKVLEDRITYLESELNGLEKDSKEYKYLNELIAQVGEQIKIRDLHGPPPDDTGGDIVYDTTIGDIDNLTPEFQAQLKPELGKTTINKFITQIKAVTSSLRTNLEQKIAKLTKQRDAAIQANNVSVVSLLNNEIYTLRQSQKIESFQEQGEVVVGGQYMVHNGTLKVLEIIQDGNGNVVVIGELNGVSSYNTLESLQNGLITGEAIRIRTEADIMAEANTKLDAIRIGDTNETSTSEHIPEGTVAWTVDGYQANPKIMIIPAGEVLYKEDPTSIIEERDAALAALPKPLSSTEVNKVIDPLTTSTTVSAIINHPEVSAHTKAIAAQLEANGLKVEIVPEADSSVFKDGEIGFFDSTTNTIKINRKYLKGMRLDELLEILEHEMVHAELDKVISKEKGVYTRAEFNTKLKEIIDKLENVTPQVQDIIDLIKAEAAKADGNPEELLNYLLTNQEFFNAIQAEQNEIVEDVRKLLKEYKLTNLTGYYNTRVANGIKSSNPSIRITSKAQAAVNKLKKNNPVNVDNIKGTGKEGRVTIEDVEKYAKDNNFKEKLERRIETEIFSKPFEDTTSEVNNIFLGAFAAITDDGSVDVDYYIEQMRKITGNPKWGENKKRDELQYTLENTLKALLDPTVNKNTPVDLVFMGEGVAIKFKGTVLGFLNNPKTLEKQIKFVSALNKIQADAAGIKRLEDGLKQTNLTKYERDMTNWKLDELKGTSTNKPFITHIHNQIRQLETVQKILSTMASAPTGAKIRTVIERKTSGNLLQVEAYLPVGEVMPEIEDLYYIPKENQAVAARNKLVNSSNPNEVFTRNPNAQNYQNHDGVYDVGYAYMLIPGANSIPGQLNTYIPVKLEPDPMTAEMADSTADTVMVLLDYLNEIKGNNFEWKNLKNSAKFKDILNRLKGSLNVDLDNKDTDDFFKVFDNKIKFSFGDNQRIEISLTSKFEKVKNSKIINVQYFDSNGELVALPTGKTGAKAVQSLSLYKEDGVTEYEGRRDKIKEILAKAFSQKRHNINYELLASNEIFVVGEVEYANYKEYLIKGGVLTTNTRHLTDNKGKVLKGNDGKPLPAVTKKETGKDKDSNLIIGINPNLIGFETEGGKKAAKTKKAVLTAEQKKNNENVPRIEPDETDKDTVRPDDVKKGVETLLKEDALIVSNENLATAIEEEIDDNNLTDKLVDYVKLADGTFKIFLKENVDTGIEDDTARNKKVQEGDELKEKENIGDVKIWWEKTFGKHIPLDTNIVGMMQSKGENAWGVFSGAMVRLSLDAPFGTGYHEAFHVVFWLYNTPEQRAELLKEARDKYGNLSNLALEEIMADEFQDYVVKEGKTKKVTKKTKGFFAKLYELISNFFNRGEVAQDISKMDKLFEDIDSGQFNYEPDARMVEFAEKHVTRNKVVGKLTRLQQAEVINNFSKKLIEHRKANPNLTLKDIHDNPALDPKEGIRNSLLKAKKLVTKSNFQEIKRILRLNDGKDFDALYEMAVKYVNRQFGIEVSDKLVNVDKLSEIDKKWDDTAAFKVSQKDTVSNLVKGEIMSTVAINSGGRTSFLGLDTYLDFNTVYPYVQRNMMGALNYAEMKSRLEAMALHDPSYINIINKLDNDTNFKAAWLSQFTKAIPQVDVILYGNEGIKLDNANKNTSHYILADKWQNAINTKLESGELTRAEFNKIFTAFQTDYDAATYTADGTLKFADVTAANKAIDAVVAAYNAIGVDLTRDIVEKTINSKITQANLGSREDVLSKIFYKNFVAIHGGIDTQFSQKEYAGQSIAMVADQLTAEEFANEMKELEKAPVSDNSVNRLNDIALYTNVFQNDLIESSYFDALGNNVYGATNPSFLSNFFDKIKAATNPLYHNSVKAKADLLAILEEFAKNPAMAHSNWLWDTGDNNGALIKPEVNAPLTTESLNLVFLNNWLYSRLDGVKNTNTKEGFQYNNMPDKAWELTQLLMYMESSSAAGYAARTAKIATINPADSGNIHFVSSVVYDGVVNGTVTKTLADGKTPNPLYVALRNTVRQEQAKMIAARDLMFIVDKDNTSITPKEHRLVGSEGFNDAIHLDYTQLEKNYYWTKTGKDGLPIIAEQDAKTGKWTATGNVFKFNNITAVNDIENIFRDGVYWGDRYGAEKSVNGHPTTEAINVGIDAAIGNFVREQKEAGKRLFGHAKGVLAQADGYGRWENNFENFITEFMLNNYISNVEQFNFLVGNQAEFGIKRGEFNPSKDINKRAKQIVAPGVSGSNTLIDSTYRAATIKDIELESSNYEMIANNVAKTLKVSQPELYGDQSLNIKEINKLDADYSKMNDLDKAVYKIIKGYLEINIGDGQGYVSVERAEAIIKDFGRWNPAYEALFKKVKAGEILKGDELAVLLQPFKGFYYGRDFNPTLNRHTSTQIKYSTVVLIPQLYKGTELEKIHEWMAKNKLGEVQFESAEKIGSSHIIDITGKDGKVNQDVLDTYSEDKGYKFREYIQANWRLQLDVPDHMVDSQNKLGTQISKIIIGNLPKHFMYNVAGTNYTRDEYIAHYMDVMIANIKEDGGKLRNDIGVELEDGEFVIKDMKLLSEVLMSEIERRGISDNYAEAIELDENGQFNMPLFINSMGTKWESILTSLFTNRVIDQKTPGASGVLLSSAFLEPITGVSGDKGLNQTGIQWSKEVVDRDDYKLQMTQSSEDGVIYAEALLPAWSKKFYVKDKNGDLVLDDIDNIPEELRTMVTYRIPTERDYSATVIKVVGFLPAGNGSAIVLPEEYVVAKGFDFDVDKEFIMYHNFGVDTTADGTRSYKKDEYHTHTSEGQLDLFNKTDKFGTEAGFLAWAKSKRAKEIVETLEENPTEEHKKAQTQVDRFNTTQANRFEERQKLYDEGKSKKEVLKIELEKQYAREFEDLKEALDYITTLEAENNIRLEVFENNNVGTKTLSKRIQNYKLASPHYQSLKALEKNHKEAKQQVFDIWKESKIAHTEQKTIAKKEESAKSSLDKYKTIVGDIKMKVLREEFSKLSEVEANSRKARDNRILDVFIAKLAHPGHFSGVHTPQSFDAGKSIIEEINEITKEKEGSLNPTTVEAQLNYRKQNISGRALKGMAANSNAFLNVAQVAEMFLINDLGFEFNYRVGELTEEEKAYNEKMLKESKPDRVIKTYTKAELVAKYGAENVVEVKPKTSKPKVNEKVTEEATEEVTEKVTETGLESKINKLNADLEKAKYEAEEATGDQLNPYLATIESLKTIKINTVSAKTETGGKVGGKQDINIGRVSNSSAWTVSKLAERLYEENSENIPNFEEQDYKDFIIEMLTAGSLTEKESEILGGDVAEIQQELDEALREYEQLLKEAKAAPSKDTKYLTVKHTNLGFNNDGTFTNINGANTMDHSSQILAMILDIVKEGIPFNLNTYTFSSFITMLNTGVDMRYAGMFVRQPILKDLSETFFETQGFTEDERVGKEIEIVKNEYGNKLWNVAIELGVLNDMKDEKYEEFYEKGEADGTMNLTNAQYKKLFSINMQSKAFDVESLKNNIRADVNYDSLTLEEKYEYLKEQIRVIEAFKTYKKSGEAYDDIANAAGTDRTQVGPSLTRPETLKRQIDKATYYLKRTTADKLDYLPDETAVRVNGKITTVIEIKATMTREKNKANINKTIKPNTIVDVEKGARILSKVNGEEIPATIGLYPELFEKDHDSTYSVLEAYYNEGFKAASVILSPMFIKQSAAFQRVVNDIISSTGLNYTVEVADRVAAYLSTYIQKQLPWFYGRNENAILGLDEDIQINTDENIDIEAFKKLSAANKVLILQSKMKAKLADDSHILNYLKPKTGSKAIAKNSMHVIEFINTKTDMLLDDRITDSFQEMWSKGDEFERALAEDLVYYSFLTTGFSMKKNSFSKLIPTAVYKDIGLKEYLYAELNKAKVDNRFDKEITDIQDKFIRSNWFNSDVVPYLYSKRKYHKESGLLLGMINSTPNWDAAKMLGTDIIRVNDEQLQKEGMKVYQSPYIVVPLFNKINGKNVKVKDVLYKRFKTSNEGLVYFYPVDKLGNINIIEFSDKSRIKENQAERTPTEYETAITDNNNYGLKDTNANHMSYKNTITAPSRSQSESIMFITATSFIGQESKHNRESDLTSLNKIKKSFGTKANVKNYSQESKVMVIAPTTIGGAKGTTIQSEIFDSNGEIKKTSEYYKIYDVLKAGGTVMLKSPVNVDGDKLPNYKNEAGNGFLISRLKRIIKKYPEKLYGKIENDILYYSKTPFDSEILTQEVIDALKGNSLYKPDNKGCD